MSAGNTTLCSTCEDLQLTRSDFESPSLREERYGQVIIGDSVENLREKQLWCTLCHLFWQAIVRNEVSQPHILEQCETWTVSWDQSCMEYSQTEENDMELALYPKLDHPDCHSDCRVQLVDSSDTLYPYRARLIPPMIDPEMIIGWLGRCKREHGPKCSDVSLETPPHPLLQETEFLVIDVNELCLCKLPDDNEYVTLSYVWGKSAMPSTLSTNVEQRKVSGALSKLELPQTISDTIEVVRALCLRYLWIDTLCIVQDHISKYKLIDAMDAVYMHADLCIVAASGENASAGLSGWSSFQTREGSIPVGDVKSDLRLGVLPFFDGQMMHSSHASRAWTFQEGALSSRCLVFLNSQVYFCCRTAIWREDINAEFSGHIEPGFSANTLARTLDFTVLRRFSQCIDSYTSRDLTFDDDVLKAFAGMEKALSRSMNRTRFWYGIPALVFDWALLWTTARGGFVTRRADFPSYSWAGWKGSVGLAIDHYAEFDQEWLETRTWIEWYVADESGNLTLVWDPIRDETIQEDPKKPENNVESDGQMLTDMIENKPYLSGIAHDLSGSKGPAVERDKGTHGVGNTTDQDVSDSSGHTDSEIGIEFCPSYAEPNSDDPYGHKLVNNLNVPITHPRTPPVPQTESQRLRPGTLCFETYIATYTLAQPPPDSKFLADDGQQQYKPASYFNLVDNRGRFCGVVWDQSRDPETKKRVTLTQEQRVNVLILSYTAPGTKQPFSVLNLELPPPYEAVGQEDGADVEEWIAGEWHTWDMLNVMLVVPASTNSSPQHSDRTVPIVWERHSLGLLHKNALFNTVRPLKWEMVCLY